MVVGAVYDNETQRKTLPSMGAFFIGSDMALFSR